MKNISQIGSFPQIGVKIKYVKPPPSIICGKFVVEIWNVYCLNLGLLYLTPTMYILWLQLARSPAIFHASKHGLDSITMITDQSLSQLSQPISIYLVAATCLKSVSYSNGINFGNLRANIKKRWKPPPPRCSLHTSGHLKLDNPAWWLMTDSSAEFWMTMTGLWVSNNAKMFETQIN